MITPPPAADIVELLAIVNRYRAEALGSGRVADAATLAAGDLLVELVATHFPDARDQGSAGVAIMLAAGFSSICAERGVPSSTIGAAMGAAAARLIEGA